LGDAKKLADIMEQKGWSFFHFTDTRNLPFIREHGLLPMRTLAERGIAAFPGGNTWSLDADQRSGMDAYVHLCFFREHPMEWLARQDGRIQESRFLKVSPRVLDRPGALITDGVSNKATVAPKPADEMIAKLDLEVIYTRTDWKDPKVQARLKAARLCEILVPGGIGPEMIRNLG
jgi:ssDNA thymidine ADP-ribosyltransferase, DarT